MDATFKTIFHNSPVGTLVIERKGPEEFIVLDVNPAAIAVGGWKYAAPQDLIGRNVLELFKGIREYELLALYHQVLDTGEPAHLEDFEYEDAAVPYGIYDVDWIPLSKDRLVIFFRNVTREKQAERALRLQKDFNDLVIQTSPNLIFVKDKDGTFLMVNQAMADSFGMSRQEMVQKRNAEVHNRSDEVEAYAQIDREVIEQGKTRIVEEPFTTPASETRWYHTIKTPLVQPDGTVHVLGISTDITELKQAQQAADHKAELERLVGQLEAKNAELERFTYTVSHDLKSPLVTIKGFLGLLEQDAAEGNTERMQQDMAHINRATDLMGRLLGELLELSRIGRQMNVPEAIALGELAQEAVAQLAGQIAARGVRVEMMPELPVAWGDRVRLLEVFQNLIDNAVKFMGDEPEPLIEVGARLGDGEVLCFVRDNGIGILPEYHKNVFGLFNRLDQRVEGTGIGLALVKRIVEVHGGRIWIESEGERKGSTFYFTLPQNG